MNYDSVSDREVMSNLFLCQASIYSSSKWREKVMKLPEQNGIWIWVAACRAW